MTSLLFSISIAALLSVTSLIVVFLRASPLLSPGQALPAFFLSLLLTVTTLGALLFYAFWKYTPIHTWSEGKILTIALRQGLFLGLTTVIILLLHLLGILTIWLALLVALVFILIEVALHH